MNTLYSWCRKSTGPITFICGTILIVMSLGITVEVLIRKFFSLSIGGVDELSGYGFAIFTSFAFSFAALQRANIRIEILRSAMPGRVKVVLDLLAQLSLILFSWLLAHYAVLLTWNSFSNDSRAITPLATPLALPQSIWTAGLLALSITLTVILVVSVAWLIRGDKAGFERLAGPGSEAGSLPDDTA